MVCFYVPDQKAGMFEVEVDGLSRAKMMMREPASFAGAASLDSDEQAGPHRHTTFSVWLCLCVQLHIRGPLAWRRHNPRVAPPLRLLPPMRPRLVVVRSRSGREYFRFFRAGSNACTNTLVLTQDQYY